MNLHFCTKVHNFFKSTVFKPGHEELHTFKSGTATGNFPRMTQLIGIHYNSRVKQVPLST